MSSHGSAWSTAAGDTAEVLSSSPMATRIRARTQIIHSSLFDEDAPVYETSSSYPPRAYAGAMATPPTPKMNMVPVSPAVGATASSSSVPAKSPFLGANVRRRGSSRALRRPIGTLFSRYGADCAAFLCPRNKPGYYDLDEYDDEGQPRAPAKGTSLVGILHASALCMPAVFIGVILNLLDAASYGLLIFPTTLQSLPDLRADGFSMLMWSTVLSQIVFTAASGFKCATASMMIEVIPFYVTLANIVDRNSADEEVLPTLMTLYVLSTLLVGLTFFLLGYFNLGQIVQHFPKHVLVGAIGGVGWFLGVTAIEYTSGVEWRYSTGFFEALFDLDVLPLWTTPLAVALLLRPLQRRFTHHLFVPCYFMVIPVVFFVVVAAVGADLDDLRKDGWLLEAPDDSRFYSFFTRFDFGKTNWGVIPEATPTILGLVFFGILHVPVNVPSLALSTGDIVDTNTELLCHGVSNVLAGLGGTSPNYLVYSNSLLYFRAGGNSRLSGIWLTIGTAAVFFAGPTILQYLPLCLVGAMIYHLAIDLLLEALWDTRHELRMLDYLTVWAIVVCMGVVGFMEGIGLGIGLACVFFVVNYSQKPVVRTAFSADTFRSTVRRLQEHEAYLKEVGREIHVVKLQGYLFFGTINELADKVVQVVEENVITVRFLIFEMSLVSGVDFSAAGAFGRCYETCRQHSVEIVFCGKDSHVRDALVAAGLLARVGVHDFHTLNEALEWCENLLLEGFAPSSKPRGIAGDVDTGRRVVDLALREMARPDTEMDDVVDALMPLLVHVSLEKGRLLWEQDEDADSMYFVQSGQLAVVLQHADEVHLVETILPGAMLGDLTMLAEIGRNVTVIAAADSDLLQLTRASLETLDKDVLVRLMRHTLAFTVRKLESYVVNSAYLR